jgi:hypothetical protein
MQTDAPDRAVKRRREVYGVPSELSKSDAASQVAAAQISSGVTAAYAPPSYSQLYSVSPSARVATACFPCLEHTASACSSSRASILC